MTKKAKAPFSGAFAFSCIRRFVNLPKMCGSLGFPAGTGHENSSLVVKDAMKKPTKSATRAAGMV